MIYLLHSQYPVIPRSHVSPTKSADADFIEQFECVDYDHELDSWGKAVITLLEAMLAQDGQAHCYRGTSERWVGTILMCVSPPLCTAHWTPSDSNCYAR